MMLYTHSPLSNRCLGVRPDVRTPLIRPQRSMLLLAGLRYAPGSSGLLLPALSAASTSFASWRTLRSSTSSSSTCSCCFRQEQQPLSGCWCSSCRSTSSSADRPQDSTPLLAARWQLLQLSAVGTTRNQLLPAAACHLAVAAAAVVPSDTGGSSSSSRERWRRSRRSVDTAAATAVVAPPGTAAAPEALLLPHISLELRSPSSTAAIRRHSRPRSSPRMDEDQEELSRHSQAAAESAAAEPPPSSRRRTTNATAAARAAAAREEAAAARAETAAAVAEPPPSSRRRTTKATAAATAAAARGEAAAARAEAAAAAAEPPPSSRRRTTKATAAATAAAARGEAAAARAEAAAAAAEAAAARAEAAATAAETRSASPRRRQSAADAARQQGAAAGGPEASAAAKPGGRKSKTAAADATAAQPPSSPAAGSEQQAAASTNPKRGGKQTKAPATAAADQPPPAAAIQQPAADTDTAPAAPRRRRQPKTAAAQVEAQPAVEAAEPTTVAPRGGSRRTKAEAAAAEDGQHSAAQVLQQARLLQEQLNEYCAAYYNGQPLVADDVYDAQLAHFKALLQQLTTAGATAEVQELEQNSPITRVGAPAPAVTQLRKVRHPTPMTSLAAMRDKDEILAWASRLERAGLIDPDVVSWAVEPKVDGMALRVVYRSGKLALAATRGDGSEGEDITHNMLTGSCQGLPATLTTPRGLELPDEFEVRGELYMKSGDFEALNEEEVQAGREGFANPRNVAAGSARLLDPQEFARRRLSFMAYQLFLPEGTPNAPTTQSGSLDWMKRLSINTTTSSSKQKQTATYDGFQAAVTAAEAWMESRNTLDYEVDGAVLKVDNLQTQAALGCNGARDPKWAVAWKFPAKEVTTILRGIEWSVGKTGAVTPVALLEPVECGGVTVSRASLHNLGQLRALEIRMRDTVVIKRAGDVIPQLIRCLPEARALSSDPVDIPSKCPSCTRELETRQAISRGAGDQLFCVNPSCPAQQLAKLQDFASVCMKDVGPATVKELWNRGLLASPSGFYKLTKEDLLQLPAFKEKKASKVLDAIQESKQMSLTTLIRGLGIPSVGKQQAENLAKKYSTMKALQLWSSRNNGHGHDGSRQRSRSTSSSEPTGESGVLGDSLEAWFTHAHNKLLLNELRELGISAVQEDEQAHETAELQLENRPTDPRVAPRVEPGGLTPGVSDVKPLAGLSVCVTGTLTSPRYGPTREAAKQFIETRGGDFHEYVKKTTQYLVAADNKKQGKTTKVKQARAWDIPILTEREFNALIEERILQLQGYLDFDLDEADA